MEYQVLWVDAGLLIVVIIQEYINAKRVKKIETLETRITELEERIQ